MIDITTRLAQLDSCAVSDALDKLGLKGVASGIERFATNKRISGRVVTVKLEATVAPSAGAVSTGAGGAVLSTRTTSIPD